MYFKGNSGQAQDSNPGGGGEERGAELLEQEAPSSKHTGEVPEWYSSRGQIKSPAGTKSGGLYLGCHMECTA
jgi:hypothetical protein